MINFLPTYPIFVGPVTNVSRHMVVCRAAQEYGAQHLRVSIYKAENAIIYISFGSVSYLDDHAPHVSKRFVRFTKRSSSSFTKFVKRYF